MTVSHMLAFAAVAAEETKSPLLPNVSELILGTVAFFLIFFVLAKFAFPNIKKTLDERADKIEGGLARAAAAQEQANKTLADYQEQLADARTEAAGIRASAQSERQAIVEEARTEAVIAAAAVTTRAAEQIAAERDTVATSLKREIGELALDLAGKIVGESLADDARARATIDRFLTDLETQAEQVRS